MASRIGKAEWAGLYALAGSIDVIQWIADFFLGVGEGLNAAADPLIGAAFAGYFQLRGVSMIRDWKRLASLVGAVGLEELSISVAPAWIVDVWYIHHTVKKEDAEIRVAQEQEEMLQNLGRQTLYQEVDGVAMRLPKSEEDVGPEGALNSFDGVRPPRGGLPLEN